MYGLTDSSEMLSPTPCPVDISPDVDWNLGIREVQFFLLLSERTALNCFPSGRTTEKRGVDNIWWIIGASAYPPCPDGH